MVTPVIQIRGNAKNVFPAIERLAQEYGEKTLGGFKTCRHCGFAGLDVETTPIYIGGQGYVEYDYCQDVRACWMRRDDGHN